MPAGAREERARIQGQSERSDGADVLSYSKPHSQCYLTPQRLWYQYRGAVERGYEDDR